MASIYFCLAGWSDRVNDLFDVKEKLMYQEKKGRKKFTD